MYALEKELRSLDGVEGVTSPLSQKHVVKSPTGLIAFPLIHLDQPDLLPRDSIRIFENAFYASSFSIHRNAMSIYLTHGHFKTQDESAILVEKIRGLTETAGLGRVRLVGKLQAQNIFIDLIRSDFGKFLVGSILLSFSILLLIFRNLRSAFLPFLISVLSLIWLFGLMGLLGIKINLLSTLVPPIIFFVSMSDAVHLMNAIRRSTYDEKRKGIMEAVQIVWTPTLLTSVTTAIGFLSLLWINTEPIQLLGLFAALGVLIAFFITFTFGVLLATLGSHTSEKKLLGLPGGFLDFLLRNQKAIIGISIVFILALIPGSTMLKVNAYLLDDLPTDSEVRQDFEYTDEYLGGSKPYEIRIDVVDPSKTIWDKDVMDEIHKIEEYLLDYPIAKVQAPSTLIKYLNMVESGGLAETFTYPADERSYIRARALTNRIDQNLMRKFRTEDGKACRIIGFFPELGSYDTKVKNDEMIAFLDETIDLKLINYRLTGTTYLIDKSHELLSLNLIKGLLTAVLIIGIILAIYFRSLKLLLISFIPNLIPLLIVAGVLGWIGISLKMTTSIIFTIAFGIAVDDTIHMMSYYLKNKDKDNRAALRSTFTHAGSAMLITSIIMIAGFALFLLSDFGATYYLGLFVSLSLFVALVIDLTILPVLLLKFTKK